MGLAFTSALPARVTAEQPDGHVQDHTAIYDVLAELRTKLGALSPSDLSNVSTVVLALLGAADATAARSAIGAGTSNLALGSTGTTAAAGNHTHTDLLAKAAGFTIVTTTGGAYPAARPTGVGFVWFADAAVTPPAWNIDGDYWANA